MEIQLNAREKRNATRQIAYVTISGVNAQAYKFQVGDVPIELDTDEAVLEHLNSRQEELHMFCYKKTYPGADFSAFKAEENTDLEAFLEWESEGCENPDGMVIANHSYAGTHPTRYPPDSDVLDEALEILRNFANTNFEDLEDRAQADDDFIKELSKALLALIRLVDHNQ